MKAQFLDEPELQFGTDKHIDIRYGISNYGTFDRFETNGPRNIYLGVIGLLKDIEKFKKWLEKCIYGIDAKESRLNNLYVKFPGFGVDSCYNTEIILSERNLGIIQPSFFKNLKGKKFNDIVEFVVEEYSEIIRELKVKSPTIQVIVCIKPIEFIDQLIESRSRIEKEILYDFHDLLKARAMELSIPIQVVNPWTFDSSVKKKSIVSGESLNSLQDPATISWNFFTALYYKAGGTPWRIIKNSSDFSTCYVGIGFYKSLDEKSMQTSTAQVFNERGDGIILRGGAVKMSKEDLQLHLDEIQSYSLLKESLDKFRREHGHYPARVVVHKTSSFNEEEFVGFERAVNELDIPYFDFLSMVRSTTRLMRRGNNPPLRGTFWELDDLFSILYTTGSINFYKVYPGLYSPKTLKIRFDAVNSSFELLAEEILALSKMNWNNTQFDNSLPITIKAARDVGSILKYVPEGIPILPRYGYYM